MKMNRFGKTVLCLAVLLLAMLGSSAMAEAKLTFSPENPRMGEYVDVTVLPGREGALGVRYELSTSAGTVCANKTESSHFSASFRPREETVYTLTATIVYGKKDTESVTVTIPVSGTAPDQESEDVVYCQKDGWWADKVYSAKHHRSVQKSGCALFALSHALQRMGYDTPAVRPDKLAAAYSRFYINERGTDNEGLLRQAAEDYRFVTQADLIETEHEIITCLRRGDHFTFSVVTGHIAMADGVSEDGKLVHVVDSAVGATFERKDRWKVKGHVFYREEDGTYTEAVTIDQLPGLRWFFETEEYGGLSYWLDLPYCAHQGMRLVRAPWLQAVTGSELQSVIPEYAGALISKVTAGEESVRIPTKKLKWTTVGADSPQLAVITNKKGANLLDGDGATLKRYSKKQPVGTMMIVLEVQDDYCYVFWKDIFCFIARKNVSLLPVQRESFSTGIASMNGKTAGTAKVIVRNTPKANGVQVASWTIGTPVAVVETGPEYSLVEGKGSRGWLPNKYLTLDAAE